ncbi:nuclear transport factor 2 family protein [Flavobacterium capsici]|uniref:Nuclear transport factor 2 family protein n=1 Tax=Flavobacterium capsici TaxID=3075618 RepID=A0AA96EUL9_9FLAO|nr:MULTISPECIES: nuclear transport factor 2 family protein [unclassified Flavobacterium]WNM18669.1 nuclear transport factor 2 family protein [Flavobacterium sp. PMR2A8]WNM22720.1 nuclear transport factor 2 family protein [Flavobacterium sp. PMTSA4]
MKKIILLGLAAVFFIACKQEVRYTQNSPEIDTYKKVMEDYKTMNWEDYPKHYADTAKVLNNVTKDKAKTVAQAIEQSQKDAELFTWVVEDDEYEMVVTDKGETWVNYWGLWKGTMKSTGKVYQIPFHNTARFIDGKIVREYGYWDNSEIVTDMLSKPETPTPTEETVTN